MSKSAAVVVLDVNLPPNALTQCKEVCKKLAVEKMILARSDELGLVLFGTSATQNTLHHNAPKRYGNIVSACGVAPPAVDFLERLESDLDGSQWMAGGTSDFLDALLVAADLLKQRTATRKYARSIYLFSDVSHAVAHKEDINVLVDTLKRDSVTLIVVGVDFNETNEACDDEWNGLSPKATNERVLHFVCGNLTGGGDGECDGLEDDSGSSRSCGMVISVVEALQGVSELRQRKVAQRPLMKIPMSIGSIRLAVQMFTKTQEEKPPSLQKITHSGAPVHTKVTYVSVAELDKVLKQDELVRAFRYGRTRIPCTEADLEAMHLPADRGLEAVAFVPMDDVPPYILMGGVKVVGPLAHDESGTLAFTSIVRAMEELRKAMIVRVVRTRSSKPALGLCTPSCTDKRVVLFLAPLPFVEDVRAFSFSTYSDVRCSESEERLVNDLVNSMTVDQSIMRPSDTFNPFIQQYYETLRSKLRAAARCGDFRCGGVPPLLKQLQQSSTAFGSPGNILEDTFQRAESLLKDCAANFPYVEELDEGKKREKELWFHAARNVENLLPTAEEQRRKEARMEWDGSDVPTMSAPATISPFAAAAAAAAVAVLNDQNRGSSSQDSQSPSVPNTIPHLVPECGVKGCDLGEIHVSTLDPMATFALLVKGSSADDSSRTRQRAMDELVEVVFKLLINSIRNTRYSCCADCVATLRQHCVSVKDPQYFNSFLLKLLLFAREVGHEAFWSDHILRNGQPLITKKECANSNLVDDAAAESFLSQDRSIPVPELEDDMDDDVFDLIN